jgi:acetolactate synthase-1/2/3 large subunit
MILTGAQIIVETLIEQGCEVVFGYPGGFVLNIYDELYKNSRRIKHVITAHEQGAAHAADGYARASGKVGVVMATSGPGVTNLITGLATAYLDSSPVVAITGNVPLSALGKDSFQEVDSTGITMPITKHNYIVKDVRDLADTIREAFQIAKSGRPGPVLVDVPKDVQLATCKFTKSKEVEKETPPMPDKELVEMAVKYIQESQKPYIYSGGGVVISDTGKEIEKLAEIIDSPMGFSMMGLSAVPVSNKRNLGMTGMHGRYASTKANSEADLIIAVGVRFSDRATGNRSSYAKKAKVIHIDIDPAEIDKNINAYIGIVGDIKTTLNEIINRLTPVTHPEWQEEVESYREAEKSFYPKSDRLIPKTVFDKINAYCNENTVVATDVGQHQMWAAQYYAFSAPRRYLTSGGLGTMGFGMGAAIGGCIAADKAKTVLITGDGSFGMNLNEMATAVRNSLPLVVVVMNNGVLGMVRQWQTLFYDKRYAETTLNRQTDFVKLADAFGATGYRVESVADLDEVLPKAFESKTPVIIDCIIDKDEKVFPMIPPNGSIEDIIVTE